MNELERTALNHSIHSGSNRSCSDRPRVLALRLGWHRLSGVSTSFIRFPIALTKSSGKGKKGRVVLGSRFRRCQFCRQLFSFWACGKAKTIIGRGGKLLTEWKPEIKGRRREGGGGRRQQEAAGVRHAFKVRAQPCTFPSGPYLLTAIWYVPLSKMNPLMK